MGKEKEDFEEELDLDVDADVDGNSIAGLLLNFFNKYWPNLFDRNMVYKVETPIVVSINKKSKKKLLFYSQSEYNVLPRPPLAVDASLHADPTLLP